MIVADLEVSIILLYENTLYYTYLQRYIYFVCIQYDIKVYPVIVWSRGKGWVIYTCFSCKNYGPRRMGGVVYLIRIFWIN
jgi:hypothetical protein